MILRKLALTIFLILSISGCSTTLDIARACGVGGQYDPEHLGLGSESTIMDYQAALVTRKNALKMLNRERKKEAECVRNLQRYVK